VSPVLAVLGGYVSSTVYHFVMERKQRLLIKTMFSTYVNPTVVDELLRNPGKLTLGGERRELTVLFSDIESFTTIAEGMPSQELVGLLNEYLSAMTEIVFRHDGTLDKYEGDAVMAFWGAPIPQALAAMRESWGRIGRPVLNMRIGINTGEMTVGNMGGLRKFDYTVIGDSVNLASRLEGANKIYKTSIMVGESTYDLVRDAFLARELDRITVKGRAEALKIYELLQPPDGLTDENLGRFLLRYSSGLDLYRKREWAAARQAFEEAERLRPGDHPTQLYIERTAFYATNPPPPDWNGVFVMTTK
jgi:adenylate cyclase